MAKLEPQQNYQALAIDPVTDSRMRIKAATQAVHRFKNVGLLSSVSEAISRLNGATPYDVIFLSERIAKDIVGEFIKEAKETPMGQDAAYILLLTGSDENNTKAAESVLHGFDGCLMEPYSVDALMEITEIASRVKNERRESRQRAAVAFLVRDVIKHIDRIAYIKSCQMDPGTTLRKLKQACNIFKNFSEEERVRYYEVAIEIFGKADPNPMLSIGTAYNYKGASSRIRKRIVQKLIAEAESTDEATTTS